MGLSDMAVLEWRATWFPSRSGNWPLTPFLFWSKITTFLIRHYLWNLMDFNITKSLETCVSKTLFPWVADQLCWIVICWPVFMIVNEKTVLPRQHRVESPGLSWFQKNQLLYVFTDKERLSLLLNQTLVRTTTYQTLLSKTIPNTEGLTV